MKLLFQGDVDELKGFAIRILEKQITFDSKLAEYNNERQKRILCDAIIKNLEILVKAVRSDEVCLFRSHVISNYQQLCGRVKNCDQRIIRNQMIQHYELLADALSAELSETDRNKIHEFIDDAIRVTIDESLSLSQK